jgi:hypothetical protein
VMLRQKKKRRDGLTVCLADLKRNMLDLERRENTSAAVPSAAVTSAAVTSAAVTSAAVPSTVELSTSKAGPSEAGPSEAVPSALTKSARVLPRNKSIIIFVSF